MNAQEVASLNPDTTLVVRVDGDWEGDAVIYEWWAIQADPARVARGLRVIADAIEQTGAWP